MSQFIQELQVSLKGGQKLSVAFNAEKADQVNPQIDAFMKALGDEKKKEGLFLFQGARVVLIRLSDVSAVEVVSLIRREDKEGDAKKEKANKA